MKISITERPATENGKRSRITFTPEGQEDTESILPALLSLFESTLSHGTVPRIYRYSADLAELSEDRVDDNVRKLILDFEFSKTTRAHIDDKDANPYDPQGKHQVILVAGRPEDYYIE